MFSDGWAPSHTAFKSFEAFYLSFLSQPSASLHAHKNLYTMASTNRIAWKDAAPEVMAEFRKLQRGMLYSFSFIYYYYYSCSYYVHSFILSSRVYCAFLEREIFVDGDVFALLADNDRADDWSNCSQSCTLFCRFGEVPMVLLSAQILLAIIQLSFL